MDTTARRRRAHVSLTNSDANIYTHDLTMYTDWPLTEVPLSEFEDLAVERVELFRVLEQASVKGPRIFSEEWRQCIKEDLLHKNLKKFLRLTNGMGGQSELDVQARRADHVSHFILRMSYCRSEDLRKYFLARELEWFKLRYMAQTPESR